MPHDLQQLDRIIDAEVDALYEQALEVANVLRDKIGMVNERDRVQRQGKNTRLRLRVRIRMTSGYRRLVIDWSVRYYFRRKDGGWGYRTRSLTKSRGESYPIPRLRRLAGEELADDVEQAERFFALCRTQQSMLSDIRRRSQWIKNRKKQIARKKPVLGDRI